MLNLRKNTATSGPTWHCTKRCQNWCFLGSIGKFVISSCLKGWFCKTEKTHAATAPFWTIVLLHGLHDRFPVVHPLRASLTPRPSTQHRACQACPISIMRHSGGPQISFKFMVHLPSSYWTACRLLPSGPRTKNTAAGLFSMASHLYRPTSACDLPSLSAKLYELRTKLLVWGKCHHQMWGVTLSAVQLLNMDYGVATGTTCSIASQVKICFNHAESRPLGESVCLTMSQQLHTHTKSMAQ